MPANFAHGAEKLITHILLVRMVQQLWKASYVC